VPARRLRVGVLYSGGKDSTYACCLARVEADTMEKVKETITWKIRRLDRIRSTLTMIVVEG
jgi:diphthamide synthase (EF-2-diphthine--ammonia ligase)